MLAVDHLGGGGARLVLVEQPHRAKVEEKRQQEHVGDAAYEPHVESVRPRLYSRGRRHGAPHGEPPSPIGRDICRGKREVRFWDTAFSRALARALAALVYFSPPPRSWAHQAVRHVPPPSALRNAQKAVDLGTLENTPSSTAAASSAASTARVFFAQLADAIPSAWQRGALRYTGWSLRRICPSPQLSVRARAAPRQTPLAFSRAFIAQACGAAPSQPSTRTLLCWHGQPLNSALMYVQPPGHCTCALALRLEHVPPMTALASVEAPAH